VDLSEEFRGTGQQGGNNGIKTNNLKTKHHERSDEMKLQKKGKNKGLCLGR